MKTERLTVKYQSRTVGRLTLTHDNRLCAFEYDSGWLADGFSISPLESPSYDDFLAVGTKAKIPPTRCRELYEQVRENLI